MTYTVSSLTLNASIPYHTYLPTYLLTYLLTRIQQERTEPVPILPRTKWNSK